jgi:hypothetical protein
MDTTPRYTITPFAVTNFRNQSRSRIKLDDGGATSTSLVSRAPVSRSIGEHDRERHSRWFVAVTDPHGDLVEKVLDIIPSHRVNEVVYFNPSDVDYPVAFNPLESVDPKYRHLVASGLIGVFKKIWADSWGPRLVFLVRLSRLEYPSAFGNYAYSS